MILRQMRKGIFSALFLGLLVMGGVGLVLTDWNGMFRGGITNTDVAVIDGTPLKIAEFDSIVRRVARGQPVDFPAAYQILGSEIRQRLFSREAHLLGLEVPDPVIAERISALVAPLAGKGETPKDALSRFLQAQGLTEPELVQALREEISTSLLSSLLSHSVYVPFDLAADFESFQGEEREAETLFFPHSAISLPKEPDEAGLIAYYNSVQSSYMIPETRKITVALLDPKLLVTKTTVTDAEVKAAYDEHRDEYKIPEKRILAQAVVDSEGTAAKIAEKARAGKPLKDAVKAATGQTKAYLGTNSFPKDGLLPEIANPAFAAKTGDVLGPIQTALGWHVLTLAEIKPAGLQPFDQVAATIRKDIEDTKTGDQVYAVTSDMDERLAGGEALEDLAREFKLTLIPAFDIRAGDKDPSGLAAIGKGQEAVIKTAFLTPQGEVSGLNDLIDGRLYVVRTESVAAERAKDLKDVRQDVLKKWREQEQARANLFAVQTLVADLESGKVTFDKVSTSRGKSGGIIRVKLTRRDETTPKGLAPEARDRLLSADKGAFVYALSQDGVTLGRVLSATLPAAKPDAQRLQKTRDSLAADLRDFNRSSYISALQASRKVKVNDTLLRRVYEKTDEAEK